MHTFLVVAFLSCYTLVSILAAGPDLNDTVDHIKKWRAFNRIKEKSFGNLNNGAGLPVLIGDGHIYSFNGGVITLLNASGIFLLETNSLNSKLPRISEFSPIKRQAYFQNEILKLDFEQGQTISINNNIITITNSTGTYMGDIYDGRIRKISDAQGTYYGYNNINSDLKQSITIVNGVIIVTNSSGSFAGKRYCKLVKID